MSNPRLAEPARPRRVLFLDHTAAMGGGEVALLNLVRHLDRSRVTPLVCLFADGPLADPLREAGAEVHLLPLDPAVGDARKDSLGRGTLARLRPAGAAGRFAMRLSSLIRRLDVDVVHCNSLKSDLLGGVAGRLARRPVIWHVRDRIADDYLPAKIAAIFRRLSRIIPTHVIANSHATLATLGWPDTPRSARRATVVHDGTPLGPEPPAWVPNASPQVGLVGRITPWKGQDVFLRAAAEVRKSFPGVVFQIIGAALFAETDYEAEVRRLAEELGPPGWVEFTGFRSDVAELIGRLDVLVHASTVAEPFGQVIIEAMAAARPVVATRGGGVPEIVVDGETGLLVPMGDASAMAAAVVGLLSDPDAAAAMGRRGRRRVEKSFSIRRTACGVEAAWDAVRTTGKPIPPYEKCDSGEHFQPVVSDFS